MFKIDKVKLIKNGWVEDIENRLLIEVNINGNFARWVLYPEDYKLNINEERYTDIIKGFLKRELTAIC